MYLEYSKLLNECSFVPETVLDIYNSDRKLTWSIKRETVHKCDKMRKQPLLGCHLSYLVKNWRWRRGTWKGYLRVPKQRKQNPTSCPAGRSGWPRYADSLKPLLSGSGCFSFRSSHRSVPWPQWTWQHSGRTWLRSTQHSSHKIPQDPESSSLKEKKQEHDKRVWPPRPVYSWLSLTWFTQLAEFSLKHLWKVRSLPSTPVSALILSKVVFWSGSFGSLLS